MQNILLGSAGAVILIVALIAALRLSRASRLQFALAGVGAFIGLALGALVSVPVGHLPGTYGTVMPIIVTAILAAVGVAIGVGAYVPARRLWQLSRPVAENADASSLPSILVDTSVIIDGRIADIALAGFVPGRLLIPRFVLAELQNIADSSDAMRRGRGRRGLEILNSLRAAEGVQVDVVDHPIDEVKEVDAKLVRLAHKIGAHILTTDYNLNRVAQIEGVRVLNINELSNAVRPVVLPGERMTVKVVQPGKEKNQGVGYLPDGTMIVVDKGDRLIGKEVETEITRVFQTVAGKMLFAAPINGAASNGKPAQSAKPHEQRTNHKTDAAPRKTPRDHQDKAKRPARRQSPTQKLEDSLLELTKHDSN